MSTDAERARADRLAARAVGTGIGLLALMASWLVGQRLTSLVWGPPIGPTVAIVSSIMVGLAVAVVTGRRLSTGVAG